jgi:hypothetical protein
VRLELEAAIDDVRDWRWHGAPPFWLQPTWRAALELGLWLGLIVRRS